MAIYRILQNSPLGPEEIKRLVDAYERTLAALGLTDRTDPVTELVASRLFALYQTGIRDPDLLSKRVIEDLEASHWPGPGPNPGTAGCAAV